MKNLAILFSIIFVLAITAVPVLAQNAGQIVLEPDKQSAAAGEDLKITVSLDTGEGNEVNSYVASLKYPEDKLELVSINTDNSPFNMALESKGENGQIKIIRGSTKPLTGKLLSALLTFKAKAAVDADLVTVSNDSAIIRSSDNTNILPGSTVQNTSNNGTNTVGPGMGMAGNQTSTGFWGIIEWIKNFFSSLFD